VLYDLTNTYFEGQLRSRLTTKKQRHPYWLATWTQKWTKRPARWRLLPENQYPGLVGRALVDDLYDADRDRSHL
jgi:hypothetical protein